MIDYARAGNLINDTEFNISKMLLREMRNSFSHGYRGIIGDNSSIEIIELCRSIIVNVTTAYQSRQNNVNKSKDKNQ